MSTPEATVVSPQPPPSPPNPQHETCTTQQIAQHQPTPTSTQPATDSKQSSPSKATTTTDTNKVLFTPKEEALLKIAMTHCLKSGPPEIDIHKFTKYGDFNTLKTAQNTWGKIKGKLVQAAGPAKMDDEGEEGLGKTKKGAGATPSPKKRGRKVGEEDGVAESPNKKRKASVKEGCKVCIFLQSRDGFCGFLSCAGNWLTCCYRWRAMTAPRSDRVCDEEISALLRPWAMTLWPC